MLSKRQKCRTIHVGRRIVKAQAKELQHQDGGLATLVHAGVCRRIGGEGEANQLGALPEQHQSPTQ